MREVYRAPLWSPLRVGARYVRALAWVAPSDPRYRVFECSGPLGATLREYDTAGDEIPAGVRARADQRNPGQVRWD